MEQKKKTPLHHSATPSARAIDVSAALIFHHGKLLITRRQPRAHLGGLWEFPGGKREPDETFEQCLVREIREELGVRIAVGRRFESIIHAYPEKTVRLEFFVCRLLQGNPEPLGCDALRWVACSGLADYAFPAADARLLEKLRATADLWESEVSSRRRKEADGE